MYCWRGYGEGEKMASFWVEIAGMNRLSALDLGMKGEGSRSGDLVIW